jgi:hypothetical protein
LACEIGITTSPEHELGNIQKCLAASFARVFVVSPEKKTLNQIKALAASTLEQEQASRVSYCSVEELLDQLGAIETEPTQTEQTVRSYRVNVRYKASKPEEREAERGAVSAVIASSMKRRKKTKE